MKYSSTVVFVADIDVAKDFYTRILAQKTEHDFGKNVTFESGIAIWELRPSFPIAQQLDTQTAANRFELYFEHNDLEAIQQTLTEAGVRFFHPIQTEPWGQRTIRFFDPDNHLIEVGEPLAVFLGRMLREGMTVAEVSAQSGVNEATIIQLTA